MTRFSWKNRDTAAQDMLQLIYHGPARVRNGALRVLAAIRSPRSIPDLKSIALDPNFTAMECHAALQALATA